MLSPLLITLIFEYVHWNTCIFFSNMGIVCTSYSKYKNMKISSLQSEGQSFIRKCTGKTFIASMWSTELFIFQQFSIYRLPWHIAKFPMESVLTFTGCFGNAWKLSLYSMTRSWSTLFQCAKSRTSGILGIHITMNRFCFWSVAIHLSVKFDIAEFIKAKNWNL